MIETRFLITEGDKYAISLAKKLSDSKAYEIITLTNEEMECLFDPTRFARIDMEVPNG